MKKQRVFWGFCLLLFGVILVVGKLGYLGNVNAFTLIATVVLLVVSVQSLLHLNYPGILFPLAFIGILFDKELGITALTPWTLLLAALLGSIGLSLIFHKHGHHGYHESHESHDIPDDHMEIIDVDDESTIDCNCHCCGTTKYINTNDFKKANLDCSFGGMKVFFDKAEIRDDVAYIHVDVSFGGVELYIPKDWKLINNMSSSFAGVTEKNRNSGLDTKKVYLTGNASFAGVDITYV